jgi:hypothetical protein
MHVGITPDRGGLCNSKMFTTISQPVETHKGEIIAVRW